MAAEKQGVFVVEGVEYPIPERFTIGELADIEEITGQAYDPDKPGARMTLAIVLIAMRRKDKSVSLADVRALDMEEIAFPEGEEERPPGEEPPKQDSVAIREPSGPQP